MLDDLKRKVMDCLVPGEVLLIVPPFAPIELPSLAGHLLQACAAEQGIEVSVFYANLALANLIGESNYESLCQGPELVGERFFAHVAYGKSLESLFPPGAEPQTKLEPGQIPQLPMSESRVLAQSAGDFVRSLAGAIDSRSYRVAGCSSTFEQTASSISILNALKAVSPQIVTIIGGANCEGVMAKGIAALAKNIDYIFSGESERTFPEFLRQVLRGDRPPTRILRSQSVTDLNTLPLPDFTGYFEQLEVFLPQSQALRPEETWLPYESSRGCWWGEKHQCTFCGLSGENIIQRSKDAGLVLTQMRMLLEKYSTRNILPIDSIMPRDYFKTLLPELENLPGVNLFYEQKSNIGLDHLKALKRAGMNLIQPGIESLSTPILKLMNKGVSARQHIHLLRNARTVGVGLNWNLLYEFPGDRVEYYEEIISFLPHLVHFHPPTIVQPLSLERFSPYFDSPAKYGISNVQPKPEYREILPEDADVLNIAYNFVGEFESGTRLQPTLVDQMREHVANWRDLWTCGGAAPKLSLVPIDDNSYLLLDSRYNNKKSRYDFLTKEQATQLLVENPVRSSNREDYEWALSRHLMLEVDGFYVPLAISGELPSVRWTPRLRQTVNSLS